MTETDEKDITVSAQRSRYMEPFEGWTSRFKCDWSSALRQVDKQVIYLRSLLACHGGASFRESALPFALETGTHSPWSANGERHLPWDGQWHARNCGSSAQSV